MPRPRVSAGCGPGPSCRSLWRAAGVSVLLQACGGDAPVPDLPLSDLLTIRAQADAALQQDRLDDARADYSRLVDLTPEEAAGWAGLAFVALKSGDLDQASEHLTEARRRAPDAPDLILALARIRVLEGDAGQARSLLDESLKADSTHVPSLWALASLEAGAGRRAERAELLRRALESSPGNLALRVARADHFLEGAASSPSREADAALAELEMLRQVAPDFGLLALPWYEEVVESLRDVGTAAAAGDVPAGLVQRARGAFDEFKSVFELTPAYQEGFQELAEPPSTLAGVPELDFSFLVSLAVREPAAVLEALRFTEASELAGLVEISAGLGTAPRESSTGDRAEGGAASIVAGDYDGDGDEDLLWLRGGELRVLRVDFGRFVDATSEGGDLAGTEFPGASAAQWVDLDDDRRLDIWVAGAEGSAALRNASAGRFESVGGGPVAASGLVGRALFADLDHDGDLDAFEAREGPDALHRNNGDWTFTEMGATFGLAGPPGAVGTDAAFGDVDDDGDTDLVVAEAGGGIRIMDNLRGSRFGDVSGRISGSPGAGVSGPAGDAWAVALADVNHDGKLDLAVASPVSATAGGAATPGEPGYTVTILLQQPDGTFAPGAGDAQMALGARPAAMQFIDFDNDGSQDLAVARGEAGLALFRGRGDGSFEDASRFLPPETPGVVTGLEAFDYNEDGDIDLVLLDGDGRPVLLRNDGGNANHYMRLDLTGLGEGSRKNNRFGIGARIEVRAGDSYQMLTQTRPRVLVGLGPRLKADVVRVHWPNGVVQDLYFPGTDQDLIEQQTLKGSCPMLFLWNGEEFEFVGDVLWKSALGMPLGILGGRAQAFAPAFPSQEYRRLPPGVLRPRDGRYEMRITEELWETIYVDGVQLVAVDHSDSVEVFVNEVFVPPAPVELDLWRAGTRHLPVSATDQAGRDHLAALSTRDFAFVGSLPLGRYQGLTDPHELVLDLGPRAASGDVTLFLTGWIFPTDASINVAMSQTEEYAPHFPALDVTGPDGEWVEAVPNLGFPSGKDKTVIVDMRDLWAGPDRRVRVRTNLMVYWDEAFFTTGPRSPREGETVVTALSPSEAELRYRGFSREFRKGGRYGPHWFDYAEVSTAPKWRDLFGAYTRYGDVLELVQAGDDRYVIQNAGDEIALSFPVDGFPALPHGWVRTFLIYTDGWVKDGDLNTATGERSGPLPFRALAVYPYDPAGVAGVGESGMPAAGGPEAAYTADPARREAMERFNTRGVVPRISGPDHLPPPG